MKFEKYHCLENDFIILDEEILNVKELCDLHKGIGADGLLVIKNDNILFFNKDGTKAKFCGNAIRCASMYLNKKGINNNKITFENNSYNVYHNNNLYTLEFNIKDYTKIKTYYLINTGVNHLVVFTRPNFKLAMKLQKKHNANITFFNNNKASTFELGVGFTNGCGSGLLAIMTILYKEFNIENKIIYSNNNKSNLKVINNKIFLESEVKFVYKGEIPC